MISTTRQQSIIWANADPGLCCHKMSLGHNKLKRTSNTERFPWDFTPWLHIFSTLSYSTGVRKMFYHMVKHISTQSNSSRVSEMFYYIVKHVLNTPTFVQRWKHVRQSIWQSHSLSMLICYQLPTRWLIFITNERKNRSLIEHVVKWILTHYGLKPGVGKLGHYWLLPLQCQAFIRTNAHLMNYYWLKPYEQTWMKFLSKCKSFHSRKYISKCYKCKIAAILVGPQCVKNGGWYAHLQGAFHKWFLNLSFKFHTTFTLLSLKI